MNSTLENTIGRAKCSQEDQTNCGLVGVALSEAGGIQGDFYPPAAVTKGSAELQANIEEKKNEQRRR
jgi:hypothetical protein